MVHLKAVSVEHLMGLRWEWYLATLEGSECGTIDKITVGKVLGKALGKLGTGQTVGL